MSALADTSLIFQPFVELYFFIRVVKSVCEVPERVLL